MNRLTHMVISDDYFYIALECCMYCCTVVLLQYHLRLQRELKKDSEEPFRNQ